MEAYPDYRLVEVETGVLLGRELVIVAITHIGPFGFERHYYGWLPRWRCAWWQFRATRRHLADDWDGGKRGAKGDGLAGAVMDLRGSEGRPDKCWRGASTG